VNHLVAIDWGTSSLRAALLDRHGQVLEERSSADGILSIATHAFASFFVAQFDHWMRTTGTICLISGMAGSRQGWIEAPYCPCPANLANVARQLAWIEPGRIAIVPGLRCEPAVTGSLPDPAPDVMRGEETQVFGALHLLGLRDATLVLPGTHSKWVRVENGRIMTFRTFMTGEFYALLRQHSILARTLPADDRALDPQAFDAGVAMAQHGAGLLHNAFQVRTLGLFDRKPPESLPSYLSGLLIGEELRHQTLEPGQTVVIVGAPALTQRYERALASRGVATSALGSEATWQGLHAIAQHLGND
jgi:2-dehydro-3-deoxygalactonokinase